MEKDPSFFERLTFDPSLKKGFIARYFGGIRTILLIVFTLAGAGLVTFLSLPKELNPNIQIPIVFVTTVFPGAGPEDIEKLVTIPLEDVVTGLDGATLVSSTSQENASSISIEFSSGTDPQKAKEDVQNAVDEVTDLPEDAEIPRVQVLDFQNQPLLTFVLSGNVDPGTLGQFSDLLEERLKDAPGVEKVGVTYRKDPSISITLRPETIREKNLTPLAVGQAVSRSLTSYPAGNLSNGTVFALTQETSADTVAKLRALPVNVEENIIPLGEIAAVEEVPAFNAAEAYYGDHNLAPTRAISFSVFKTDAADAGKTVEEINAVMEKLNEQYHHQFILKATFDGADEIKESFDQLFHDFSLTVFLVFSVLFIFFGLRQSIIASLAIPLTFLGTFIVMSAAGISVNFIALFSLLLALGILVDNAIVIISAMASYDRTGKFTPDESALLVWRDFKAVIFTTTITTVWAFLPLLLASGIIGEFIKPIPIVVSSALAISAAIALFIVTPLMAALLKGNFPRRTILFFLFVIFLSGVAALFFLMPEGPLKWPAFILSLVVLLLIFALFKALGKSIHQYEESHYTALFRKAHRLADQGLVSLEPFAHRYQRFIERMIASKKMRRRILGALIFFSLFSYALLPLGFVVNEFFPSEDTETVNISVELPQGTSLKRSKEEMLSLLERFRTYPDTRFVFGEIGAGTMDDGSTGAAEFNNLLFTVMLVPEGERDRSSGEVISDINREFGSYNGGTLSASQISGGPPAGSDLQLKLLGDDLSTLQSYGKEISDTLKNTPGVTNVSTSIVSGSSKIVFVPNKEKLAKENIAENDTAFFLRTLGSGYTIESDARFGEKEHDVVLRFSQSSYLENPDALGSISYPASSGNIPFLDLGEFKMEPNPTRITREDGKRTLSVSAGVEKGYSVSTLNKDLEARADALNLPEGYSWKTGGVNDENNKSVQSIMQAMILSGALIFGTMVIQFNSFRKALIVLLVIPLAISGVFVLFALTGTPLSFPALIGVLALFGIVVNNSIIMVDKINRNMDAGLPLDQAISEGAASRLEPILLTALTAIVGLIPITFSDPIWRGLGGAIIAGLTFSGVAKLLFIPVIYKVLFATKEEKA